MVATPGYVLRHQIVADSTDIGAANPLPVKQQLWGSTGTDFSANAATVPISTYVLVATIPVNATRAAVEVQNQSAAQIQVVRDVGDGTQATSILLAPGTGANTQGGSWASATFKGRIRVYAPSSGAQVSASQD